MASNFFTKGISNVNNWINNTALPWINGNGQTDKEKQLSEGITDNTVLYDTGRFVISDEILQRFHLGNEFGSQSNNDVFAMGYEDPTYLMFKVEFGDWGYSLLDLENIRTQQRSSKFTNVYYEDYDQFPMGLLDANFIDYTVSSDWNNQTAYNTYNYLMNRNEDARANYIMQFVKGLYVLQKDMPYIFQKISGLDKLQEFNSTIGKRLKDVQITLECIEGLDLKIKTLLELYRKAAYDEVWQRWTLPDIYRYFKMIIYVFDRRILHNAAGAYSIEQNDFPIYAFECGPCEFDIKGTFEPEYSVDYKEQKNANTKIIINVKNVKTYFSNQLFNKVRNISNKVNWIGDFDSTSERQDQRATDSQYHTNFKQRWIRRMFMIPSEYRSFYDNEVNHKFGHDQYEVDKLQYSNEIYGPILPDNSWHEAVVTDPIYSIRSWGGLKKFLKKLLVSHTTMVRDSRTPDRTIFQNDLTRPWEYSYIYDHDMPLMYIDQRYATIQLRHRLNTMIQHMLNSTYLIDNNVYYNLVDPEILFNEATEITPDTTLIENPKPEMPDLVEPIFNIPDSSMTLVEPEFNESKNSMIMVKPNLDAQKNDMELVSPIFDEHKNDMNFVTNYSNPVHNDMNLVPDNIDGEHADMDLISPIFDEHKNDMNFVTNYSNPVHNDMNLVPDNIDGEHADMTMIEPIFDEHKNDMNLVPDNIDGSHADMELVSPIFDEHKNDMEMVRPIFDEHKNSMELISNYSYITHNEMVLIPDNIDGEHNTMNLVPDKSVIEHNTMNLVPDKSDIEHNSMNLVPDKSNIEHNSMNLVPDKSVIEHNSMNLIPDKSVIEHNSMNLVPDKSFIEHNSMNLVPDNIDADHNFMNLIPDKSNPEHNYMNLVPDKSVIEHNSMNLIPDKSNPEHNLMNLVPDKSVIEHNSMNLVPDNIDGEHAKMNLLVEPHLESKSDMELTPLIGDEFKPQLDLVNNKVNIPNIKMDMVKPNNESIDVEMDMVKPDMHSNDINMDMAKPNNESIDIEMNMVKPDMRSNDVEMDMVKPDMHTNDITMDMVKPNNESSIADMTLISPNNETKLDDMVMVKPNNELIDIEMDMVKPDMHTNDINMELVKTQYNENQVNMELISPQFTSNNIKMDMVEPDISESNIDMKLVNNTNETIKPELKLVNNIQTPEKTEMDLFDNKSDDAHIDMKMQQLDINADKPTMDLYDNIVNTNHKVEMNMVDLTSNKELSDKLKALVSINVNEINHTNLEDLLSLADLIEETVYQIKDHQKHMKLIENKTKDQKRKQMKMVRIKQPDRNQFQLSELHKVDQNAIDRAFNAKRKASDNNYSTNGNKGIAL